MPLNGPIVPKQELVGLTLSSQTLLQISKKLHFSLYLQLLLTPSVSSPTEKIQKSFAKVYHQHVCSLWGTCYEDMLQWKFSLRGMPLFEKKKQHVTWNSSADLSSCFMKQEQNNFRFQCWIVCTAQTCELSPIQHASMPPSACASTVPASALFLWHAPHAYMRRGLSSLHVPTNVPQCVSTLIPSATMPFLLSDYETHTLGSSWLNISVPSELTIRSAGKRSALSTTWLDTWFSLEHKKEKQFDVIISSFQKWIYSRMTLKTLATANTFDVLLSSRAHSFFTLTVQT